MKPLKTANDKFKNFKEKAIDKILIVSGSAIVFSVTIIFLSRINAVQTLLPIPKSEIEYYMIRLVFMCVGFFAIVLGFERTKELTQLKDNLKEQSSMMQKLNTSIEIISKDHNALLENIKALNNRIELTNPIKFPLSISQAIEAQVEPELALMFKKKFSEYTNFLTDAINFQRIEFKDSELFTIAYRTWLANNPKAIVYATSSPNSNYYWRTENEPNSKIENTIEEFIKNGGEMHRIFYVTEAMWNDPNVISRINKQVKFGVQVYVCQIDETGGDDNKFFIVDKDGTCVFEIYTTDNLKMKDFSCCISREYSNRFLAEWETLMQKNHTTRYTPSTT